MAICKFLKKSYKKILILTFLLFYQTILSASVFDDLRNKKKTSYLDFVLLKIENRLVQRHSLLGPQPMAVRVQYQRINSQVDFVEEESKIIISIIGVMNKKRYSQKKYEPKLSDCNILRNILLYGKYGYNIIFQKRNKYLTSSDMKDIFVSRFLKNISLSENEKEFIVKNTIVNAKIIDPVRGKNISCSGNVAEDLN